MITPELKFLRNNANHIFGTDADVFLPEDMLMKFRFNDNVTLGSLVNAGYLHVFDKENFLLQFTGEAVTIAENWRKC